MKGVYSYGEVKKQDVKPLCNGETFTSSDTVELLGITLDKNINFQRHIQNICHKANNKTKALFRIRKFLNLDQAQVLAEAYISANFRYCPLIWIFFAAK